MKQKKHKPTEWIVKFHGETKVKAYTEEEAKAKVEQSKSIDSSRPIRTESTLYWIGKGLLMNVGAIMTTLVMLIMIFAWGSLIKELNNIPEQLRVVYLIILATFILVSMRIPKIIGDEFEYRGN